MPARPGQLTVYRRRRRRRVLALGALLLAVAAAAAAVAFVLTGGGRPSARETAEPFLADWSRGADRAAARWTDRPAAAAADLEANRQGLDGATVSAKLLDLREEGDTARARIAIEWRVPGIGRWAYESRMTLQRGAAAEAEGSGGAGDSAGSSGEADSAGSSGEGGAGESVTAPERGEDDWVVVWRPQVVHPQLNRVRRLGTTRDPGRRGNVLGRDGQAIVRPRTVYRVGLSRPEVRNVARSVAALAGVVDVDRPALTSAVRGAGPQQFVEAITLREGDYDEISEALEDVPGALAVRDQAPLAESRGFARALLGTVGPATAEQLEQLGPEYGPGDEVGQSGLQARYERRLGGTASRRIVIRVRGVPTETLVTRPGRNGRPVRTTLDPAVQRAAETALGDRRDETAMVAIEPSTGDVLAVANRPLDSSYDRALEGRYPPGSTFKVVTTAALLRAGLQPQEVVDCPPTTTVGGRSFRNFEGGAAGAVPFAQDFAESCNTAFVGLTERLPATALREAGRDFGLGERLELGMPVADSQVPPGRDLVARAAAMIGQDRILASPLAMAGVAATVADGRWRAPRLLAGDPRREGPQLEQSERDTLRTLMRSVVTEGTGTALASIPGAVHGKSGTAEYGGGDPPPTHAWFIAYRDDVAVAVLVENGRSGGSVAAPIAARFFAALP
jgi:cell division protein FtsI/penicillin-binding protein 2